MIRRIIHIDREKCSGCGACAEACHEGGHRHGRGQGGAAAGRLLRRSGGLPARLPRGGHQLCGAGGGAYSEEAVREHRKGKEGPRGPAGCPDTGPGSWRHAPLSRGRGRCPVPPSPAGPVALPDKAGPGAGPLFPGAKLLIAADCTAYAYANMHQDFMRGKITLVGCPKLDAVDYSGKLREILENNDIRSLTIVRMEVPCCGGLELAAKKALQASGKFIPWQVVTLSVDGRILD